MSANLCPRRTPPMFSTATVPGLIQAYAASEGYLPFYTRPERLKAALADPARVKGTIERLQQGARLLMRLDCLEDGSPEALESLRSQLRRLAMDAFRGAEQGGDV